jgi:hypothetical protein
MFPAAPAAPEGLTARGAPMNAAAQDVPAAAMNGTNQHSERVITAVTLSTGGTDRTIARLKRDRPDLAECARTVAAKCQRSPVPPLRTLVYGLPRPQRLCDTAPVRALFVAGDAPN